MTTSPSQWTEWWDATRHKSLLVQVCKDCDHRQHYPRALCLRCGSDRLAWIESSGTGEIYSFTVSYRSPEQVALKPPYVIALINLAEGPRLLSRVVADKPEEVECGQAVTVAWVALDDGRHLPVFEPVDKGESKWTST